MSTGNNIEFVWPKDKPEMPAAATRAIETALKLAGGNPDDWDYYLIVETTLEMPAGRLYPGLKYMLKLHDNNPFLWPEDKGIANHSEDSTIKEALEIAGIKPDLFECFFIAEARDERSLQFTSDGKVYPGVMYYLRTV